MRHIYYQLFDAGETRWTLGTVRDRTGSEIDSRAFQYIDWPIDRAPATLDVYAPGDAFDYSTVDTAPVVRKHVADLLARHCDCDIERYPIRIHTDNGEWEILKIVKVIDCIDPLRSVMMSTWKPPKPGDALYVEPSDPDYTPYGGMLEVMIDVARVGRAAMFRPKYRDVAVIVRDDIVHALEAEGVTGVGVRRASP